MLGWTLGMQLSLSHFCFYIMDIVYTLTIGCTVLRELQQQCTRTTEDLSLTVVTVTVAPGPVLPVAASIAALQCCDASWLSLLAENSVGILTRPVLRCDFSYCFQMLSILVSHLFLHLCELLM